MDDLTAPAYTRRVHQDDGPPLEVDRGINSIARRSRNRRDNAIEQIACPQTANGGQRKGVADSELVELQGLLILPDVVSLVHSQNYRLVGAAQQVGDLLIHRRRAASPIREENDDVGLVDRQLRLLEHAFGHVLF